MMAMLDRFDQLQLAQDDAEDDYETLDDDESALSDHLVRRFAGIDLDAASFDEIWSLLSPEERAEFERRHGTELRPLDHNPSECSEESVVLPEPWWQQIEKPSPLIQCLTSPMPELKHHDLLPEPYADDLPHVHPSKTHPNLCFNFLDVLFAYIQLFYILPREESNPNAAMDWISSECRDPQPLIHLVWNLSNVLRNRPFQVYASTEDAWSAVWQNYIQCLAIPFWNEILPAAHEHECLEDVHRLLSSSLVVERALADFLRILESTERRCWYFYKGKFKKTEEEHAELTQETMSSVVASVKKLAFHLSLWLADGSALKRLSEEVKVMCDLKKAEQKQFEAECENRRLEQKPKQPVIEEL